MKSGSHYKPHGCGARSASGATLVRFVALAIAVSGASSAFAELGGAPTLPLAQRAAAESRKAATPNASNAATSLASPASSSSSWSTRELTQPDGLVEREYLNADGTVFAVAWRGPRPPELSVLLGASYATQMARDARELRLQGQGAHGSTSQRSETFSVQASTHQRLSVGVAWLPHLLPAGTDPGTLSIAPGGT